MQVQVNSQHGITHDQRLEEVIADVVRNHLGRFENRVTRVEVHLKDANSNQKGGARDKHCTMEARITGHQPVAANHHAPEVAQAYTGAASKLERLLDNTFGRLNSSH